MVTLTQWNKEEVKATNNVQNMLPDSQLTERYTLSKKNILLLCNLIMVCIICFRITLWREQNVRK